MGHTKLPAHVRRQIAPAISTGRARNDATAPAAMGSREDVLDALSEREFQSLVRDGLKARGYVVFAFPEMRLTRAGWPDLTFFHPNRPGTLFVWELKTSIGQTTDEQDFVLEHLATVEGLDVRTVRPSDWDILKERM